MTLFENRKQSPLLVPRPTLDLLFVLSKGLMLNDQVNDDALMLERNGLIQAKTESELETVIKESTSDLPLGKALNLLLNIHARVFDKAVTTVRESAPAELAIQSIESPTIRALISIENYLTSTDNFSKSFDHVYSSLEDKFIKRSKVSSNSEPSMRIIGYFVLYSKSRKLVQQYISQLLYDADKRSQLAAVMLLQFLFTSYISAQDIHSDISALFIPPLTNVSQKYADTPTLLACSSCDLALQFSRYIALHLNNTDSTTAPITELEDTSNLEYSQISEAWKYADTLLYIMEKWYKSMGDLELASFKELHSFLSYATKSISDTSQQSELIAAWDLIVTYLTPKSIVSEKPLNIKKQKALFNNQTTSLLSAIKMMKKKLSFYLKKNIKL
ncbi:hypothetical protein BD770DRAFT_164236 [Pilaira anomala]|nr:hypothetical protein BD770DRAFT_164236 [Pilaira anomala]